MHNRLVPFFVSALMCATPVWSQAQEQPTKIDEVEANTVAYNVESLKLPPARGTLRISGERRWDGFFISAERIEFDDDATLVFTEKAISMRGNLYILAREITSKSQERPGKITWEGAAVGIPPDKGSAAGAGGYPGDDQVGNPGAPGEAGNAGYRGHDAPQLTLAVAKTSGPLVIDLAGQAGGQGGKGQNGGRGGTGGNGHPASQSAFDCKRGAGNGGAGGVGGPGGQGGVGGEGGSGGTFTIVTSVDNNAAAAALFRVILSPGSGGAGGIAGDPGDGGDGGQGAGRNLPYCRTSGSNGPQGAQGMPGTPGQPGNSGRAGDYLVGPLSVADIDRILVDR